MKTDLKIFTKSKKDRLAAEGIAPDEIILSAFTNYADAGNYTQILFEFGKQYLEVCLTFHEIREEYEICAEIIKQVNKYNRSRGENIKLVSWAQTRK